jgi:hypothetical protein
MKIVIEFYRTREADDARAVVGRETADAADLDDAIEVTRQLWRTLDMPQQPDAISINDSEGNELCSGSFERAKNSGRTAIAMNAHNNYAEARRHAFAIGVWENEGGAPTLDNLDHVYGRRIETDRSWTVYHAFTGAPARIDGDTMTGLTQSEATNSMLSLNHVNAQRRKERSARAARLSSSSTSTGAVC